jgi:hypothetical protein
MKVLVLELLPLDGFADDDLQLVDVERLGDVVDRAGLERFDGGRVEVWAVIITTAMEGLLALTSRRSRAPSRRGA